MLNNSLIGTGFLMAMCLFIAIFIMPVFSRELRQNESMLLGYWFVIVLHQIFAFLNVLVDQIVRGDALGFQLWVEELAWKVMVLDALGFQLWGEEIVVKGEWSSYSGAKIYMNMLGVVYRWFSPSHLLGEQLSILAFALSCIVFIKLMRQLGVARYRVFSLLAFGALPSMALWGSLTLREPYQIFFFMLVIYFAIKMHMKGGINAYLIAMIMSIFFVGLSHRGLMIYATFLLVLFIVWTLRPVTRRWNIKKLRLAAWLIIPIFLAGMMVISTLNLKGMEPLSDLMAFDWLNVISVFRESSTSLFYNVQHRATYGVPPDFSSLVLSVYYFVKMYVFYLFAPFPWQIENMLDVYAAMESVLRMILIYFSVEHWRNTYGTQRRLLGLMLIVYFSMTFLWAVGTTNYGTAMRHHMLSWWILVIVGVPQLLEKLSRFRLGSAVRRHSHSLETAEEPS